jgi:hypothetical protein
VIPLAFSKLFVFSYEAYIGRQNLVCFASSSRCNKVGHSSFFFLVVNQSCAAPAGPVLWQGLAHWLNHPSEPLSVDTSRYSVARQLLKTTITFSDVSLKRARDIWSCKIVAAPLNKQNHPLVLFCGQVSHIG